MISAWCSKNGSCQYAEYHDLLTWFSPIVRNHGFELESYTSLTALISDFKENQFLSDQVCEDLLRLEKIHDTVVRDASSEAMESVGGRINGLYRAIISELVIDEDEDLES
jgi:hypothetical protein